MTSRIQKPSEINQNNEPKVFIVLVNYNGGEDTIECLQSILTNNYKNYSVVIVDNNSKYGSVEEINKWSKESNQKIINISYDNNDMKNEIDWKNLRSDEKLIMIRSNENLGFSGGNNIGIKYSLNCNAQYVLLLNNDTVVTPDFLMPLISDMKSVDNVGIVGGKIYDYYNKDEFIAGGYLDYFKGSGYHYYQRNFNSSTAVSFLSGCLWLVKREIFEEVGLLDENFFLYIEDVEYCHRVLKHNKLLIYNQESVIYHKESRSTGKASPLTVYYNTRNRLYFVEKCYDSFFKKLVFYLFFFTSRTIKILIDKKNRKYIIKGIKDYINNNLGKSKGI